MCVHTYLPGAQMIGQQTQNPATLQPPGMHRRQLLQLEAEPCQEEGTWTCTVPSKSSRHSATRNTARLKAALTPSFEVNLNPHSDLTWYFLTSDAAM